MRGIFRRARSGDEGFAMLLVVGSMAMASLFVLATMAAVVANSAPSRGQQDGKAAEAAAQAGIQEYLTRLNGCDDYWRKQNTDATNPAFSTAGRELPGLTDVGAKYRYSVLTSPADVAAYGVLRLRVEGTSSPRNSGRTVTRVMTATIKTTGSTAFTYTSDLEAADPALYTSSTTTATNCSKYWYSGRSSASGCVETQWNNGDVVSGPSHTNDVPLVYGSPTLGVTQVESSWPTPATAGRYYRGTGTPAGTAPSFANAVGLPSGNSTLLQYVNPRPDGGTPGPGCLYRGATRITFTGTTMKVLSPATTTNVAGCYNGSTAGLRATEQTVPVPPVIYVQSTVTACTDGTIGYPATNEVTDDTKLNSAKTLSTGDYSCTAGSAYVKGTVTGRTTIGTENDLFVVGDLTLGSRTGTDMTGLVSGGQVWVYNPVKETRSCSGIQLGSSCLGSWSYSYANLLGTPIRTIEASVLSPAHSFLAQNPDSGSALSNASSASTKLTVFGSVTQKFHGPLGTGNTAGTLTSGYLANFVQDTRLSVQQPPYFPRPSSSPWRTTLITEG